MAWKVPLFDLDVGDQEIANEHDHSREHELEDEALHPDVSPERQHASDSSSGCLAALRHGCSLVDEKRPSPRWAGPLINPPLGSYFQGGAKIRPPSLALAFSVPSRGIPVTARTVSLYTSS